MKIAVSNLSLLLFVFACADVDQSKSKSDELQPSYSAPVIILLDTMPPPRSVPLKDVPPPRVVAVPKTSGGYYKILTDKGEEKINLLTPTSIKALMPVAHFSNFNTEDGLALASVLCGLMDKKGRLWFGTTGGGVSCYDGTGFTNFNPGQGLAQSGVNCITEDKKGNLWFGTFAGGVSRYDGISFTNYTTREGLAGNTVFSIASDKKGNLWFGTYQGVSRYDGTKFTTIDTSNGLPFNNVNMVAEDSRENLWFVTFGGGVCRYDGKDFTTFTADDGLPTNYMLSIFEDSKGNFWFGSYENGVSRYDGKKFTTITIGNNPANNTVNSIAEDKDGNLWFATLGGGVIRYDPRVNDTVGQGNDFTVFTTEQGLASNTVNSITKDQYENLWFGSMGGGLSRYNGKALNTFSSKQGLPENYITIIAEDQAGNLWFGTNGNGIIRYDGKNFTSFTTEQGLANNIVGGIVQDKYGNLWFGTNGGGMSRFDGTSFTTFTTEQGLADNYVANMVLDKDGNLWIGTLGGGINRFDGKEFTTFTTEQGLAHNVVTCIAQDKSGNLWFGTVGGGVSRFDGKRFTNFTTDQGLANNTVSDIKEDRIGNLWFACESGVSRYDGSGFTSFTTRHGLPNDQVLNIAEDEQGVIWLGTNQGFCSLKFKTPTHGIGPGEIKGAGLFDIGNEKLKTYEPVWDIYNNKTGYPVKDMVDRPMIIKRLGLPEGNKKEAGVIWAPTGDIKVIRFDPKAVVKNSKPPAVFIRSIKIDEETINWYGLGKTSSDSTVISQQEAAVFGNSLPSKVRDSLKRKFGDIEFDGITPFYPLPKNLILPYHHNQVGFDFGAIETNRNFMVRYQYILEGYNKEWSPITEKTSATFGNIAEGSYTFKLKARSPEGVWSEPISYSFKVLSPWWRTWWFRTLMGISFLSLLYGLYRWRTGNLHKQKRILEKTVTERTAEVVKQKEKSDELLLNILPSEVADELKEKGYTTARSFDEVTVLFSDIKGFTNVAENMTAQELVKEINTYFSAFDGIIQKFGLEKIKTIGDAYIAAGGLPEKNAATAKNVVEAAIAMQQQVEVLKKERTATNNPYFELRIGIHTGPVVAGVVGIKKFQYDIWGDTVNLAARMEQSGVPGKINISQHTYDLVKAHFTCIHRGKIDAKNKGEIDMYFVD